MIGKVVDGRYRIARKLGQGAMGTVYLAEHVLIEKKVAIKIMSGERDHDSCARFAQEARAASRIGHENIVDVTDLGETEDHSIYIAMEYLEGRDLLRELRRGPLPIDRCAAIFEQVCSAVQAAHDKGIVHRDLKPDNIFLVASAERPDFVKILDFGLARVDDVPKEKRLTQAGMLIGTPYYMSPEQCSAAPIDHRADVYAAGCVLFEMLTGDVPFKGDPYTVILDQHRRAAPRAPSKANPKARIKPAIDAVVLKAMAKQPSARYQSMNALARAFADACAQPRAPERDRATRALIALAAVMLTCVLGVSVWRMRSRPLTAATPTAAVADAPRAGGSTPPGSSATAPEPIPPAPPPAAPGGTERLRGPVTRAAPARASKARGPRLAPPPKPAPPVAAPQPAPARKMPGDLKDILGGD
jgi:serine/threonine-protein kinase